MSDKLTINQIMNLVKESNAELNHPIFIPSQGIEISAKPMNASHLKDIMKISAAGIFMNNAFNQELYAIIKDVFGEVADTFNVLDKMAIVIQLRRWNIKPTITVDMGGTAVTMELNQIIERIKSLDYNFSEELVEDSSYKLKLKYPSIRQENKFETYFSEMYIDSKKEEHTRDSLKELFGPLFINEITRYIDEIQIKEQVIPFSELSVVDRITIVESLPGNVTIKLIEKMDKVFGSQLTKLLTVERKHKSKIQTGSIVLDPTIFV
jgi:hypothetical protein